jgi:LAS superfamily LD-carboxypeptidase LdcB
MGTFYTDVISKHPSFNSERRINDLGLLDDVTRQRVQAIIADAKSLGFDLLAFETYRSSDRQQQLFNHGATRLRQVGVHHYGLACDLVKVVNGEPSWGRLLIPRAARPRSGLGRQLGYSQCGPLVR